MGTSLTVRHVGRPLDDAVGQLAAFGLPTDPTITPDGGKGVVVTFSESLTANQVAAVHMLFRSEPEATAAGMGGAASDLVANQAFLAQSSPRTAAQIEAQTVALTAQLVKLALFSMGEPQ